MIIKIMGVNFRILEIHIFYNCGLFYWHLIEILWLFIFLVFYYSGFTTLSKTLSMDFLEWVIWLVFLKLYLVGIFMRFSLIIL